MENKNGFIGKELSWLEKVIVTRLKLYFRQEVDCDDIFAIAPPAIEGEKGAYPAFIAAHALRFEERLCLILSFVPTLKPQILDCFNVKNEDTGKRFAEFGCVETGAAGILVPTFETLLFILAGDDIAAKVRYSVSISQGVLFRNRIVVLEQVDGLAPMHFSLLKPALSTEEQLIYEASYLPEFSAAFPASRLTTLCTWEDLILNDVALKQLDEIKTWIEYGGKIMEDWDLKKRIKPGFRVLFYGPPGTGKTFTAALLGKYTGREVYRIDLSMVVSKYIGETEKNLSNVFAKAENKDWILFFDEADALFGKRTGVNDAHDRYANQEVSFLLQRIESYDGLVVLSTNLKRNMDEAFTRRFQSAIYFPMPQADDRVRLWKNAFSPKTQLDSRIHLDEIASKYDLSGGAIVNIVQYCSLMAMKRGSNTIDYDDMLEGIRKEFQKEGKSMG